jgi:hypothetical protein
MFRKFLIVTGAAATLAATALAPTSASAWGWHGHGHRHGGWHGARFGIFAPVYLGVPSCFIVKRVVETRFGPRIRRVTVCE